jgi:hypothetical protein
VKQEQPYTQSFVHHGIAISQHNNNNITTTTTTTKHFGLRSSPALQVEATRAHEQRSNDQRTTMKTHYDTLGVSKNASKKEIKAAFRK